MTTYYTGNPIGSTAVKDLFDNSQNLDLLSTGPAAQYPDRLGRVLYSLKGINDLFLEALRNGTLEFTTPLDYVAGTVITRPNQVFRRDGEYYRGGPSLVYPYTTTGNWTVEGPLFTPIGDAALRSALAAAGGSSLINGGVQVVGTFTALRALKTSSASDFAYLASTAAWYALDVADASSADNGGSVIVAADGGRWKIVRNGALSFSNFETVAQAIASGEKQLRVTAAVAVTTSQTWPNGLRISVENGATIVVSSGVTLTIRGLVDAGQNLVFSGAGTVLGISDVRPEWFGAQGVGTAGNDTTAILAAQRCIEASSASDGECRLLFGKKHYAIDKSIKAICNIGPRIKWEGQGSEGGTIISVLTSWTGALGDMAVHFGVDDTQPGNSRFHLKGIRIRSQTAGVGASRGLVIGNSTVVTMYGGFHAACLIEDVYVEDFAVGFDYVHCRLIVTRQSSAWVNSLSAGIARRIRCVTTGLFTGDLDFHDCMWVAGPAGSQVLRIEANGVNTRVSGLRLPGDVMYNGAVNILATSAGAIFDVWFDSGFQYDAVSGDGFIIGAVGASALIANINLRNGYFAGNGSTNGRLINAYATGGGRLERLHVEDNNFLNTIGTATSVESGLGCSVSGNTFTNCLGTNPILVYLSNGVGLRADDNIATPGYPSIINVVAVVNAADYISVRGNISSGLTGAPIAITATGTHQSVSGNI